MRRSFSTQHSTSKPVKPERVADLAAEAQSEALLLSGEPSDDGHGAYLEHLGELDGLLLDLLGQLAGGRHDDGVRALVRVLLPATGRP